MFTTCILCEYVGMHVCAYTVYNCEHVHLAMYVLLINIVVHVHINIPIHAWKSVNVPVNVCEYAKLGGHGFEYIYVGIHVSICTYGILASCTSLLLPPQPHKWSHQMGAFSPSVPVFSCQAHRWHCRESCV